MKCILNLSAALMSIRLNVTAPRLFEVLALAENWPVSASIYTFYRTNRIISSVLNVIRVQVWSVHCSL